MVGEKAFRPRFLRPRRSNLYRKPGLLDRKCYLLSKCFFTKIAALAFFSEHSRFFAGYAPAAIFTDCSKLYLRGQFLPRPGGSERSGKPRTNATTTLAAVPCTPCFALKRTASIHKKTLPPVSAFFFEKFTVPLVVVVFWSWPSPAVAVFDLAQW